MKDLLVLTADSDAQALIRSVLRRHQDLQIRSISFEVERFTGRDSGMVKDGPEVVRRMVNKADYSRLILVWDHHGSGWDKKNAEQAMNLIQKRLDGVTWIDRSAAIVVVPELEEWLWHCPSSIAGFFGLNKVKFDALVTRLATKQNRSFDRCCREAPKELFQSVVYHQERRQPLPEDFERLASSANLAKWRRSETFARLIQILRGWFLEEEARRRR